MNEYNSPYNNTLIEVKLDSMSELMQFPAKPHKLQVIRKSNQDCRRNRQMTRSKAIYPVLQQQSTHYLFNTFDDNFQKSESHQKIPVKVLLILANQPRIYNNHQQLTCLAHRDVSESDICNTHQKKPDQNTPGPFQSMY